MSLFEQKYWENKDKLMVLQKHLEPYALIGQHSVEWARGSSEHPGSGWQRPLGPDWEDQMVSRPPRPLPALPSDPLEGLGAALRQA